MRLRQISLSTNKGTEQNSTADTDAIKTYSIHLKQDPLCSCSFTLYTFTIGHFQTYLSGKLKNVLVKKISKKN